MQIYKKLFVSPEVITLVLAQIDLARNEKIFFSDYYIPSLTRSKTGINIAETRWDTNEKIAEMTGYSISSVKRITSNLVRKEVLCKLILQDRLKRYKQLYFHEKFISEFKDRKRMAKILNDLPWAQNEPTHRLKNHLKLLPIL